VPEPTVDPTLRVRLRVPLAWWLPFPLLAAALVAHSLWFDFVNDDAYISFVYARNLAEHGQLVFNLGERVEGYTNFLWTVLVAAGMRLGHAPDVVARVLGTVFGVATLAVTARLSSRLRDKACVLDWLPAALLAASSGYACWCSGGLETQLYTFLFVLGVERWQAERFAASGVAFALCAMTRPEGNLLFALAVIFHFASQRRLLPRRDELRWGAAFLVPALSFFAWRWWYYGDLLPNTFYVKTGGAPPPGYAAKMLSQGAFYVWQWATDSRAIYAAPLALAAFVSVHARVRRFAAFAWLVVAVYLLYTWRIGGDFMGLHRFVMPLFVLFALLTAFGLGALFGRVPRLATPARIVLAAALLGGFGFSQIRVSRAALVTKADRGIDRPGYLALYAHDRALLGKALAPLVRPDELSWVGGAGVQPYFGRMRSYDVFGLVSRQVAHEVPPTRPRPGHQKWAPPALVLATNPTFVFHCYALHRAADQYQLCGDAGAFLARGYETCTIHVPGLREMGEYYTFLKKKDREFPCLPRSVP
jgi:arabinofuranosyltransferase